MGVKEGDWILFAFAVVATLSAWLEKAYARKKFPFTLTLDEVQTLAITWTGTIAFVTMVVTGFMTFRQYLKGGIDQVGITSIVFAVVLLMVIGMFWRGLFSKRA